MAGEKLISIMQQAARGAVGDSVPAGLVFGEVISTNPLRVKVDNRLELTKDFLVVPEHLTDHTIILQTQVESAMTGIAENHAHAYEKYIGTKEHTIKNALKTDDRVALLRAVGGQKYYILDRVVM